MDENKLKLPTVDDGANSVSGQTSSPQGERVMIEVNGQPVWVDSSKISGTTGLSEEKRQEAAKDLASRMKRRLGISEE